MEQGGWLTNTVLARSTFDGEFRTRANLDRAMESPRRERRTTLGGFPGCLTCICTLKRWRYDPIHWHSTDGSLNMARGAGQGGLTRRAPARKRRTIFLLCPRAIGSTGLFGNAFHKGDRGERQARRLSQSSGDSQTRSLCSRSTRMVSGIYRG